MNRWLLGGVVGLAVLVLIGVPAIHSEGGKDNDPVWLADYAAARKLALAAGKPLFVVFRCVP